MRRAWLLGLLALAVVLTGSWSFAHEPDGRFAIDYQWLASPVSGVARPLRISVRAIVPLEDVRITSKLPSATSLSIRAMRWAGAPTASGPWPEAGVALGAVAAGQVFVFELEVLEPEHGGGILAIGVDAEAVDRAIHEGIGITVGLPGTAPVLRNGAWEFPAERGDPLP